MTRPYRAGRGQPRSFPPGPPAPAPRPPGEVRRPRSVAVRARPGDDRGSASLWLLAVGALVVAVGLAAVLAGAAMTARHQAQVAADLGALAGARWAVAGEAVACGRASAIVGMNAARLVGCHLEGLDLVVSAAVAVSGLPNGVGAVTASARAGPLMSAAASPPRPGWVSAAASAPWGPDGRCRGSG